MGLSLNDLLKVPTKTEVLDKFIGFLRLASFPVSSWQSGDFKRHTVETESDLFSDVHLSIRNVAKGGFIKLAAEVSDDWVDLVGENMFAEPRKSPVFTKGIWRLSDTGGIGPVDIDPGTFFVANEDRTLRYFNVDATTKTLPLNSFVDLTIQAETAGTLYNVGVGALTQILTPQPGFAGSNLAQANGTWITQQGADKEANAAYAQRCLDKWATLGSGSNEAAYRYHATSSSPEITKAKVYSPGGGAVRIVVFGDAGPVSATALAAAVSRIEEKRPLGVPDVITSNGLVRAQSVAGTLYVESGRDPVATLASAIRAVDELQRKTLPGAKVSRELVIKAICVDGVTDLVLNQPADDFQLLTDEGWVPVYALVVG